MTSGFSALWPKKFGQSGSNLLRLFLRPLFSDLRLHGPPGEHGDGEPVGHDADEGDGRQTESLRGHAEADQEAVPGVLAGQVGVVHPVGRQREAAVREEVDSIFFSESAGVPVYRHLCWTFTAPC